LSEFSKLSEFDLRDLTSNELLIRWKGGDDRAADIIFGRYAARLVALIANRMNMRYRATITAEDVVQSAFGSFFSSVADGRLRASGIHSVWALMATFAKRKLIRAIDREKAIKRGGENQRVFLESFVAHSNEILTKDADELYAQLSNRISSDDGRTLSVLNGLLSGQSQREIALQLNISDRTVRRIIDEIRTNLAHLVDREPEITSDTTKPLNRSQPQWTYGQFVLRRLIGQGAFGKVYHAVSQRDDSIFAVKFLKRTFWEQPWMCESFLREIEYASNIVHPRVVRYRGWGTSPHGGPYLLMDYVESEPLSVQRSMSHEQFRNWLLQICDGLQAIHNAGIVHGDLTTNNVLIDSIGNVRLTDFGLARHIESTPQAATWEQSVTGHGTIGFLAPEQLSAYFGSIGPSTDLFALGAICYWYVTGQTIYAGQTNSQAVHSLISEAGIETPESTPKWLQPALQRCLMKAVNKRPQSVTDFLSLIEAPQ
jgi:serine/threonine protein kinase